MHNPGYVPQPTQNPAKSTYNVEEAGLGRQTPAPFPQGKRRYANRAGALAARSSLCYAGRQSGIGRLLGVRGTLPLPAAKAHWR